MTNWAKLKLKDISKSIQTGPFGSQLHQSDYSEMGTPVVMPKDLIGGKISEQSIARIPKHHVARLAKHKIETGDILYSRRGDVGRCAYAGDYETGWLCGTGCLRVTIDPSKASPRFVFYQLQTANSVGWVEKHAVGSTMLNLNTSILSNIPLSLPSLPVQRRIADILSAYDDLIENNRKQIKLLEEAAQRLYKSWFMDFEPLQNGKFIDSELGLIPEGWRVGTLGEIAAVTSGKRPPQKADCKTGEYQYPLVGASSVMGFTNNYLYDEPIIVTGRVGTHGVIQFFNQKCWPSDNTLVIHSSYIEFVYQYLHTIDFQSLNRGSTQPLLTQTDIKSQHCLIATIEIISEFEKKLSCSRELIQQNLQENQKLINLRDALLQKLMSGEINVSEIEA